MTAQKTSFSGARQQARDTAEWLPEQNRCWFAPRVIAVRQRYGLTIDQREADALDDVLAGCTSTDLIVFARGEVPPPVATASSVQVPDEIAAWDDNGNGRISCAEARAHGIAPVRRDHPAYPFMRDGNGDGVVCESGNQRPGERPGLGADTYAKASHLGPAADRRRAAGSADGPGIPADRRPGGGDASPRTAVSGDRRALQGR